MPPSTDGLCSKCREALPPKSPAEKRREEEETKERKAKEAAEAKKTQDAAIARGIGTKMKGPGDGRTLIFGSHLQPVRKGLGSSRRSVFPGVGHRCRQKYVRESVV